MAVPAVPATTGRLVTSLDGMKVGDYIACKYVATSGAVGTFSEFGTSIATEIPVAGSATPNGLFYFVKIAKGIICSDRVVQHTITWDVLNAGKVIQGNPQTFGAYSGVIRSLTGGVAYADANGDSTLQWTINNKMFPINNEYDRYITRFDTKLIRSESTIDSIFHCYPIRCWTQDTTISGSFRTSSAGYTSTNAWRMIRGNDDGFLGTSFAKDGHPYQSNVTATHCGFRPVFEYQEV